MLSSDLAVYEQGARSVAQVMPRIAGALLVAPFLSGQLLSGLGRAGFIVMLGIFLAPAGGPPAEVGYIGWSLIVAKEAAIGVMLGLGFGIIVWAAQSMGDLIDLQTGSENAAFFDPVGGHEGGRMGEFLGWLVMVLFVSSGGLLTLIGTIQETFQLWPVASYMPNVAGTLDLFVLKQGDTLFLWIVKLAAPVVVLLALVDLGLGLVGRAAPQLDVYVYAQSIKNLLAVLMLVLVLFAMAESLRGFLSPDNSVVQFLRKVL